MSRRKHGRLSEAEQRLVQLEAERCSDVTQCLQCFKVDLSRGAPACHGVLF